MAPLGESVPRGIAGIGVKDREVAAGGNRAVSPALRAHQDAPGRLMPLDVHVERDGVEIGIAYGRRELEHRS